jgi:hypothetical protein
MPAFLLMFLCGAARAEMRVWADRSGKQYTAEFSKEAFGLVFLRDVNGSLFSIKLDELSAGDTKFIRTMVAPTIRVSVASKMKAIPTSIYAEDLEQVWQVSETIQIEKSSPARFDGKLSGEIYLVGEDILTGRYLMLHTQEFYPVFNEANNGRYELTVSTKVRHWEEYNMIENRGYDYAGYLLIVSGPRGERLATKTSLNRFSDEALEALRGFSYFTFFNGDGRKVSVPRPEYSEDRDIAQFD